MKVSTFRENIPIAKQGAKLGAIIAFLYYMTVMLVSSLATSTASGTISLAALALLLTTAPLFGLLIAVPAGLVAMVLGFLTGLVLPTLLDRLKPKNSWMAGLLGFVFASVIAIAVSALFGFPSDILVIVEKPLLVFVASATWLSIKLRTDREAIKTLVQLLTTRPVALWLFGIPALILLISGLGFGYYMQNQP